MRSHALALHRRSCRPVAEKWFITASTGRSWFSSKNTSTNYGMGSHPTHDTYDRYRRQAMTEDVWQEIQDENEHTKQSIDLDLYDQVLDEILQNLATGIESHLPAQLGPTGSYLYSHNGQAYCRHSNSSPDPQTQTVIEDCSDLLAMSLSVDEQFVAYLSQSPSQTLAFIKHIDSKIITPLPFFATADYFNPSSIEFGPLQQDGSHSIFIVGDDHQGRPCSIWACTMSLSQLQLSFSKLILLQHFSDPATMVTVQRTKGCHYVAIQAQTKTTNDIYLCKDAQTPHRVLPPQEGLLYHIDVGQDNDIYALISHPTLGLEFTLWKLDATDLPQDVPNSAMTKIAGQQTGYAIADMEIFLDFIALMERSTDDASQRIRILTHHPNDTQVIVQMQCSILALTGNMHYQSKSIRFQIEDPVTPPKVYQYNLQLKQLTLLSKKHCIKENSNDNTSPLQRERIMVTSKDGTQVPMSLFYKQKINSTVTNTNCTRPTILFGYGSYGEPINLSFDPTLIPFINRHFVLAYAHTRGGGDLGKSWYHQGRLYNKPKAIQDYIACAHALMEQGITEPHKLTLKGFSAGAVLVAAAANQEPELFGCAVLTNGFLDVLKTLQNSSLYLTPHEYQEWGHPDDDPSAAQVIASYCPVSNAGNQQHYARFLVLGNYEDTQVPYWNALIYGKKIREHSRTKNKVHIHIENHGGHQLQVHVAALEAAFICRKACYYGFEVD